MSPTLGDWVERRVDELIEELRPEIAKAKLATHDLREIEKLLAKATTSAAPRAELGELLAAVYEDPADTARRLVYADALLERGDERGELITLQCQSALTPVQQRRERALLKAHAIDWLGELAPIVKKDFVFERGFLASCTIDSNKGTRIKPVVGHPAWSTVHTLADSAQIALHPVMRALRTLEFRPNRARQREGLDDAWRELLAGRERPLERLYFTDLDMYADHDQQLTLLRRCDALPNLRELHLGGTAAHYHDELFRSPIAARVDTLGFLFDREDVPVDDLCQGLLRHSPARRVIVRHEEMTLKLERGDDSYERATFDIVCGVRQACWLIDALPASIRELTVNTPEDFDRGALVALSSAKRQWSRRQAPATRSP